MTLPERIEQAQGADRALDYEILCLVDPRAISTGPLWNDPDYTSSIDAALTLVPEGWRWAIRDCRTAVLLSPEGAQRDCLGRAATPALALCAAALRAKDQS